MKNGLAIFLPSTLWLVWDGAFYQSCFEGGIEVVFAEGGAVFEFEPFHELEGGKGLVSKGSKEGFDLVAYLVVDLVALLITCDFVESLRKSRKQEFNELGGLSAFVGTTKGDVVFFLALADHAFDRFLHFPPIFQNVSKLQ